MSKSPINSAANRQRRIKHIHMVEEPDAQVTSHRHATFIGIEQSGHDPDQG